LGFKRLGLLQIDDCDSICKTIKAEEHVYCKVILQNRPRIQYKTFLNAGFLHPMLPFIIVAQAISHGPTKTPIKMQPLMPAAHLIIVWNTK